MDREKYLSCNGHNILLLRCRVINIRFRLFFALNNIFGGISNTHSQENCHPSEVFNIPVYTQTHPEWSKVDWLF